MINNVTSFIQQVLDAGYTNGFAEFYKSKNDNYDLDVIINLSGVSDKEKASYLLGAIGTIHDIGRNLPQLRLNIGVRD